METFVLLIIFFIFLGGVPLIANFGNGVGRAWNNFLIHREKVAKIKAVKELKQLPASEEEVPPELVEAWREVNVNGKYINGHKINTKRI